MRYEGLQDDSMHWPSLKADGSYCGAMDGDILYMAHFWGERYRGPDYKGETMYLDTQDMSDPAWAKRMQAVETHALDPMAHNLLDCAAKCTQKEFLWLGNDAKWDEKNTVSAAPFEHIEQARKGLIYNGQLLDPKKLKK